MGWGYNMFTTQSERKDWKAKQWFQASKKEYDKYKKNKKPLMLAQAGEKLWNSFGLYLDEKSGKNLIRFKDVVKEAMKDKTAKKIFDDAYWMHIFFYRGYTEDIEIEEGKYKKAFNRMKKVI